MDKKQKKEIQNEVRKFMYEDINQSLYNFKIMMKDPLFWEIFKKEIKKPVSLI